MPELRPTAWQTRRARAITAWYLDRFHDTEEDIGAARMYTDPAQVGHLAVDAAALRRGDGAALFTVLLTTAMFQRLADRLVKAILRRLTPEQAAELSSPARLLALAEQSGCPHAVSLGALLAGCDLGKDPDTRRGMCRQQPDRPCALKRHTELLRRYGHFGKVPTSLALTLRAHGTTDLAALHDRIVTTSATPAEATARLQAAICRAWRVSDKISAMFLSAVSNPDLSPGLAPWAETLDWRGLVVIDSNVDLFLKQTGHQGPWTYAARRELLLALARRIDLSELKAGVSKYNPRIVQQALYLFMSASNRRTLARDCGGTGVCGACDVVLRTICARCG